MLIRRVLRSVRCLTGAMVCVLAVGSAASQPQTDAAFLAGSPSDSPRLARLERELRSSNREALTPRFWDEVRASGAPLIEPVAGEPAYSWVTFLWRAIGDTSNVVVVDGVAAGVGGADPTKSTMWHLGDTDVWYRTYKVRNDAVFTYTLSPNDTLEGLLTGPRTSKPRPDPLNPNQAGPQSAVRMPAAGQPAGRVSLPAVPAGTIERSVFTSKSLHDTRPLQVYTPPGFARSGSRYPLLVVLDAGAYADFIPVPAILDALIAAKRIPPIVAVLVGNANRAGELPRSRPFADFLADELVPWSRETYGAGAAPEQTIVAGSSFGGLASAFVAFEHPEVFGNVLTQSGSFWWSPSDEQPEWLTRQFAQGARRPVRVVMSVGAMEIPQQLDTNRRLRDVLASKGYRLDYAEFNGNHSYLAWQGDFGNRLAKLLDQ